MTSRILLAIGLGFALAAMSCKEGPTAGELEADLTTPNSDDGALQFTATAATNVSITGISQGCSGCKLFVVKVSDTQYRGVVTGNLANGALFRVGVSDVKKPNNYTIQVNAVSNRTYALRSVVSNYSIKLK